MPTYCSRHVAGVAMECDQAGHTIPIIDPRTGEMRAAQIYVAVLSASQLTFAYASLSQKLPDWIEANQRAFSYFGGVTQKTICDKLKSAVAKALWFEPTLNATFAAFAEHSETTVVPACPRHPLDKPSAASPSSSSSCSPSAPGAAPTLGPAAVEFPTDPVDLRLQPCDQRLGMQYECLCAGGFSLAGRGLCFGCDTSSAFLG